MIQQISTSKIMQCCAIKFCRAISGMNGELKTIVVETGAVCNITASVPHDKERASVWNVDF
jgi:hypothetical protein